MQRPELMEYKNYREYLGDWYLWMKETRQGFSYRTFSRWAGFKSPNQLQLIIQGKRNITPSTVNKFVRILKFSRRERTYFELLVNLNQATTAEAKAGFLLEISSLFKRYRENLKHSQFEYLMKWYYPVIRELVTTDGFRPDRHAIARRVGHGVTPRNVDEAMEKLETLGLIRRDAKGRFVQADAIVSTGEETDAAASYFYHRQMMHLALAALDEQLPDERNFTGITLACRKDDVGEIAQMITDCRRQILAYLESRGSAKDDDVYQLNFQFFRVTDGKKRGRS
jgi:uncharacterized protein (TIGR02147 family)